MRKFIFLFLLLALNIISKAQNPNYDKALADSLGADEYGMKPYVLVILKTGSINVEDKSKRDSIFRGHLDNITNLVKQDKLIIAGPIKKNDKSYRGIFILNVKTPEEAKPLLNTDPAISSGILDYELFQWYGSAALSMYLKYSEKIEKNKH